MHGESFVPTPVGVAIREMRRGDVEAGLAAPVETRIDATPRRHTQYHKPCAARDRGGVGDGDALL